MKKSFPKILFILLLILILAGFLRFYKLGNQSFIADEFLGINISYGHNQTGEWKYWDFNNNKLTAEDYTRANVYFWQVSKLFDFLEVNEHNARIISVLWGLFSIIIVFFVTRRLTKNNTVSLLSSLLMAISITALMFDRKLRMYSMFAPVYFLFSISIFQFFESKTKIKTSWFKKLCEKTKLNWTYFVPVVFLGVLSLQTHLLTVNIFPAILIYLLVMGILVAWKQKIKFNKYFVFLGIGILATLILILGSKTIKDSLFFFSFVQHWGYLEKVLFDYSHALIALTFFIFGAYYLIKNHQKFGIWILISFFAPYLLAIFVWDQVTGIQYIYFTAIFKIILIASGIYFLAKKISEKFFKNSGKFFVATIIFFLLILINFSFFFSKEESYYADIKKWNHSNYRETYKYFLNHRGANSLFIGRNLSNFYLWGSETPFLTYGKSDKLTLSKLQQAQKDYDEIWLIFSKDNYIQGKAVDHIEESFELIETKYTNNKVKIWKWEKE